MVKGAGGYIHRALRDQVFNNNLNPSFISIAQSVPSVDMSTLLAISAAGLALGLLTAYMAYRYRHKREKPITNLDRWLVGMTVFTGCCLIWFAMVHRY